MGHEYPRPLSPTGCPRHTVHLLECHQSAGRLPVGTPSVSRARLFPGVPGRLEARQRQTDVPRTRASESERDGERRPRALQTLFGDSQPISGYWPQSGARPAPLRPAPPRPAGRAAGCKLDYYPTCPSLFPLSRCLVASEARRGEARCPQGMGGSGFAVTPH